MRFRVIFDLELRKSTSKFNSDKIDLLVFSLARLFPKGAFKHQISLIAHSNYFTVAQFEHELSLRSQQQAFQWQRVDILQLNLSDWIKLAMSF